MCEGIFDITDSGDPIILIATKNATELNAKKLLLHEFSHFLQWKDGFMQTIESVIDGWKIFDKWIGGKNYPVEVIDTAHKAILLLEYDAEIRSLQLARQLNIDIGPEDEYIREANDYITFLRCVRKTRDWSYPFPRGECKEKFTPEQILSGG